MRHSFSSRALAWFMGGLLALEALGSQAQMLTATKTSGGKGAVTSSLPAPTGSPSNTIAQASGSNVVVDLTKRQGYNVPASLFGVSCGHLTIDGGPYDYHSLNSPAHQAAIKSMSFGLVRLNWDLNTTMDYIFGGKSVSFASVDNFINNASLFGLPGKPLIITIGWPSSMNNEFRNGTPSAATLATYQDECRQVAAYFKSKGLSGIYWGLGNEIDAYPMANIVAIFNAMQAGIYQADGTAQCGGITDSWRNDGRLVAFVQGANPKPKFLDWHGYWGNASETDDALIAKAISTGDGLDKLRTNLANAGFARNLPIGNTEFNVNGDPSAQDVRNGNYYACLFAAIVFQQQITHDHAAVFAAPWDLFLDSTYGMIDGSGNVQPLGKFITRAAQALPGEACAASVGTSLNNVFVLPTVNGSGFGCLVINASSSNQTISLTINGLPGSSYTKTEHSAAHPNGQASPVTASAGAAVSLALPAKSVCVLSGSGTVVTPPTPAGIVSGGTYKLLARHSGKALDVDGGQGQVQQYTSFDNDANQEWVVTQQADGSYKLTLSGTSNVLDVRSNSNQDGAVVQLHEDNGTSAQRWQLLDAGNGYYKLKHQGTSQVLDVPGFSQEDGVELIQYENKSSNDENQQWQFVRLDNAAQAQTTATTQASRQAHSLAAYPNPSTGPATLRLMAQQAQRVTVSVHNAQGRMVRQFTVPVQAGSTDIALPAALPAGTYYLRAIIDGQRQQFTLKVE